MFNFAITVKRNNARPEEVCESDYDVWVANAKEKGLLVTDLFYEHDSKGRLHMHAVGQHKDKYFLRRALCVHGYGQRIDFLPTWLDLSHWNDYILKDQFQGYQFLDPDVNGH